MASRKKGRTRRRKSVTHFSTKLDGFHAGNQRPSISRRGYVVWVARSLTLGSCLNETGKDKC